MVWIFHYKWTPTRRDIRDFIWYENFVVDISLWIVNVLFCYYILPHQIVSYLVALTYRTCCMWLKAYYTLDVCMYMLERTILIPMTCVILFYFYFAKTLCSMSTQCDSPTCSTSLFFLIVMMAFFINYISLPIEEVRKLKKFKWLALKDWHSLTLVEQRHYEGYESNDQLFKIVVHFEHIISVKCIRWSCIHVMFCIYPNHIAPLPICKQMGNNSYWGT
jgi:hypothetical protein